MDGPSLSLEDLVAVKDLKKLRQRSMRNPRWRDARYLHLRLERRDLQWAIGSPLEAMRLAAESALGRYQQSEKRGSDDLDAQWAAVVAAVDSLIAEAERLQGHKISATP